MAGSPGAGKTEWSHNFLQAYIEQKELLDEYAAHGHPRTS
jgi:hypothetical protein